MCVRQDPAGDCIRWNRERRPVAQPKLFEALEQSAIDEDAVAVLENVSRSGDRARPAKERKRQRHRASPQLERSGSAAPIT
jgi:hypothetical protein